MPRGANTFRTADLDISGRAPAGQLGHVLIGTDTFPLVYAGAWSANDPVLGAGHPILYHKGQVVDNGGSQYLCLATNTNDAPPSGNWDLFDSAQYVLNAQRVWTKIPSGGIIGNVPSLEEAYFTPNALLAWWRLGETTPWPTAGGSVGSWALDSSGNGHHMTAINLAEGNGVDPPAPEVPAGSANLPSLGVTGAIASSVDDGAIFFNYDAYHWTGDFDGKNALEGLTWPESAGLNAAGIGAGRTLSVFLNYAQQGAGDSMPTAIFGTGGGDRPIMGTWFHNFGIGTWGWQIRLHTMSGVLTYEVAEGDGSTPGASFLYSTTAGLIPGRWYHLAIVVSKVASGLYLRRILLNLTEVFSGTFTMPASNVGASMFVGGSWDDDIRFGMSRGGVDELSLWNKPLSDAELSAIFNVASTSSATWTIVPIGSGGSGSIGSVGSSLPGGSGSSPLGTFMEADGAGGSIWTPPPIKVYRNGA